jgi:hypothetical protein
MRLFVATYPPPAVVRRPGAAAGRAERRHRRGQGRQHAACPARHLARHARVPRRVSATNGSTTSHAAVGRAVDGAPRRRSAGRRRPVRARPVHLLWVGVEGGGLGELARSVRRRAQAGPAAVRRQAVQAAPHRRPARRPAGPRGGGRRPGRPGRIPRPGVAGRRAVELVRSHLGPSRPTTTSPPGAADPSTPRSWSCGWHESDEGRIKATTTPRSRGGRSAGQAAGAFQRGRRDSRSSWRRAASSSG